ncbi:MAG: hypothetical protein V4556_09740 [Bacteroidota bacterium]
MNRRSFLTKSSVAMVAAAGLPKAIFANDQAASTTVYKTKLESGIVNQTYYELTVDHLAVQNLATAADDQKKIILKVAYFETADFTTPTKGAEFIYTIKESVKTSTEGTTWKIKTKFDKRISGDYKLPKDFPKNITFEGKPYAYFKILNKKEEMLVEIPYPTTSSSGSGSGSGCFLTTACVENKQLADDCNELTALRFLRDEYMKNNAADSALITDYKIYGPAIVAAIDKCDNKNEIYDFMYANMIQPSVTLVKEEKFEAAVEYYKIFVKALAEKYL